MANLFTFGSSKKNSQDTGKDYFSTTFISSTPPVSITEEDALKIPAVKSSIELISSSIAQLPIYLFQEKESQYSEKVEDFRVSRLNHEANDHEVSQTIKKKVVQDYLLRGKAYLYKKNGKLFHVEASKVRERKYTDDGITLAHKKYIVEGVSTIELQESEVIVIDSGTYGLLADSGQLFRTALSQLEYSHSLMANGSLPVGILKATSRLTEAAINRLRSSWENLYSGAKKAGKTMILEEGLDYQPLSLKPDELQLIESGKAVTADIARVFNIPLSMIDSSANKYASNEQNTIQFLQSAVGPILTAIESSLDKHLLTLSEKDKGFYFRFETDELLRTTQKEKIENITLLLEKGLISFNEARYKLDMKPIEKDYFKESLGTVLKDAESGELTIPNMGVVEGKEVKESQ